MISGYCIAATAESTARARAGVGAYFKRRFRRIFPPYWIVAALSLVLLFSALAFGFGRSLTEGDDNFPVPSAMSITQWIGSISLTETWRHHVIGTSSPRLLFFGPSWTLCYEEQFYAVCGLLLAFGPRRFWLGLVVVSSATLVVAGACASFGIPVDGYFFDGRWLIFAAWLVVYYCLNQASVLVRRALVGVLGVALAVGVLLRSRVMPSLRADRDQKLLVFEIVVGITFALALIFLRPLDERLAGSRLLRPFAWCGEMCFSLYLVHWPVTVLVSHAFDGLGVRRVWPVFLVSVPSRPVFRWRLRASFIDSSNGDSKTAR